MKMEFQFKLVCVECDKEVPEKEGCLVDFFKTEDGALLLATCSQCELKSKAELQDLALEKLIVDEVSLKEKGSCQNRWKMNREFFCRIFWVVMWLLLGLVFVLPRSEAAEYLIDRMQIEGENVEVWEPLPASETKYFKPSHYIIGNQYYEVKEEVMDELTPYFDGTVQEQ